MESDLGMVGNQYQLVRQNMVEAGQARVFYGNNALTLNCRLYQSYS
jgi:hypothetical protein